MSGPLNARTVSARALDFPAPRVVGAILAIALTLVAMAPATVSAHSAGPRERPTIVLVHGAWAGPRSWDAVVAELHEDGFRTVTPTLGLQDMPSDVAIVRAALDAIRGTKILVGHSYGGAVISQAAAGRKDVLGLVYTAAFVPDQGESLLGLGQGYLPPSALANLIFEGAPPTAPTIIDPTHFRSDFAQDLSPRRAATLADEQIPTSLAIFAQPAGPVAWHTLPSWYAISGADQMIDPALQLAMAQRMGATTIEFSNASHAGGFTRHARQFVRLIERAVTATAP